MAFYQDAPRKHTPKRNYASEGSWADEGTHYSRRSSGRPQGGSRPQGSSRGYSGRSEQREERGFASRENRSFDRSRGYSSRSEQRDERKVAPRENRSFDRSRSFGNRPEQDIAPKRFGRPPVPTAPASAAPRSYRDFQYQEPVKAVPAAFTPDAPVPMEEENPQALVLAGRNPIREALKAGRDLEKLYVQRGELSGSAREIVQLVKEKHIPVQETEKVRLDEMAPHHQGLVAIASAYQYATVEDMLALAAQRQEDPFLVLLDGVTDPHNLGAIIRTAECAGAHGVILPERRSVGLTPAAVKASAGAIEHLKVARVTNLNRTIEALQQQNVWAYAMTMDGRDYEKVDFKGGVALVIGAEGEGISRLTREICDVAVSLPLKGELESLNASVAAGIMMYRILAARSTP